MRVARDRHTSTGFALLGVLVVSMLASMIVISLLYRVRVEHLSAHAGRGGRQAWSAAMSGVYHAASIVRRDWSQPTKWLDSPRVFERQLVLDDGVERWFFTVFAADDQSDDGFRHGVTDESAFLNLHGVPDEILEKIPGMSRDRASVLRDALGASRLVSPYRAAYYHADAAMGGVQQGRLAHLDDLLLIEGLALETEAAVDEAGEVAGVSNPWARYLTTFGVRASVDSLGRRRMDLNHAVDALASLEFPRAFFEYLAFKRQQSSDAAAFAHPSELLEASVLVGGDDGEKTELKSGITVDFLPDLLDRCTTVPFERYVGPTVNVNTASAEVLQLLPGIDESLSESIVSTRRELGRESGRTTAWLVEKGLVDVERFKEIAPYLTARGFQYRVRVVGYGERSGVYRILEAVIDVSDPKTRVVSLRDRTRDGLPFAIPKRSAEEEFGS